MIALRSRKQIDGVVALALRKLALDATVLMTSRFFQVAANLLALPIFARLLQPSDFGLYAAANSVLFLANVLANSGFASSLVRTDFADKGVWSSVFWLTAAWSACLSLVLAGLAIPFAWLLNQPKIAPLIAALAILPLVQGLMAAPMADLQQRHRFGWIGIADILGTTAGIIAAVLSAVAGAGAWALIAQSLTSFAVKAAVVSCSTRFRPGFSFDRHLIAEHLHFARNTGAFAFALFLSTQIDSIVIARLIGYGPLGQYSMAYRIMNMPTLLGSSLGAFYPRLVKLRNDKQALRQIVLIVTMALALIVFPPVALGCVASRSIFTVLLSARWSEAATVFSYFAPVGALQAVGGIHVIVLMAVGRTDVRLRMAIEFSALWVIVLLSTAHFGIQAIAIGLLLAFLAYYPRFLFLFLRPIECPISEYLKALVVPLCVSIAIALMHVALRPHVSLTPLLETASAVLESLIAYGVIGLLLRRRLSAALAVSRTLIRKADEAA